MPRLRGPVPVTAQSSNRDALQRLPMPTAKIELHKKSIFVEKSSEHIKDLTQPALILLQGLLQHGVRTATR